MRDELTTDEKLERTLACDHWKYVENVLITHDVDSDVIQMCGFHYRSAFVHGWKHAMENMRAIVDGDNADRADRAG